MSLGTVHLAPIGDGAWPSRYRNDQLVLMITIYVDHFRMVGELDTIKDDWSPTNGLVELGPPT